MALDELRDDCGSRSLSPLGTGTKQHSIEARKAKPGKHTEGIAADIMVKNGSERMIVVKKAIEHGFHGVGVAKTFVHVDSRDSTPVMWVY